MPMLPSLYVSHGSPMLALNAGNTGLAWQALAHDIPKPRAILMVSAHWLTRSPQISASVNPATIHDFGGFPEQLYTLQYPAPGAPELAHDIAQLLETAGLPIQIHPDRGLDHGAWVPLRSMYPNADIPVLQLSLQAQDPQYHFELGKALASLREQGILLIGSGSMTHNFSDLQWEAGDNAQNIPAYVGAFQNWFLEKLQAKDYAALVDYRRQAPGAVRAHPTEEHLLPLFVMLGAATQGQIKRHFAGITEGALAMDVYSFGNPD